MIIQPIYCNNPKGTAVTRRATRALVNIVSAKEKLMSSRVKNTTLKTILFDVITPLSIATGIALACSGSYFLAAMSGVYAFFNGGIAIDYHKKLRNEKEKKKQAENELQKSSEELKNIIDNTNFLDIINRFLNNNSKSYNEFKLPITKDKAKIISESACSLGGEEVSPCIIWDELQYEAYLSEQENGVKWF